MRRRAALWSAMALLASALAHAAAAAAQEAAIDATLCEAAIAAVDREAQLPARLLGAISLVESGRVDPATRRVLAWPWTINVQGQGRYFESKAAAVAAAEALLASGQRSIDVGCMQINLRHHPAAFASLEHAFSPHANVSYGASFLRQLYRQTSNWPRAAAAYHSQTPELAANYQRRVMSVWPLGARFIEPARPPASRANANHTPEFARELARDAADRSARDPRLDLAGNGIVTRRRAVATHAPGGYTPEFARQLALDAAARVERIGTMRGDASRAVRRDGEMRRAGLM